MCGSTLRYRYTSPIATRMAMMMRATGVAALLVQTLHVDVEEEK